MSVRINRRAIESAWESAWRQDQERVELLIQLDRGLLGARWSSLAAVSQLHEVFRAAQEESEGDPRIEAPPGIERPVATGQHTVAVAVSAGNVGEAGALLDALEPRLELVDVTGSVGPLGAPREVPDLLAETTSPPREEMRALVLALRRGGATEGIAPDRIADLAAEVLAQVDGPCLQFARFVTARVRGADVSRLCQEVVSEGDAVSYRAADEVGNYRAVHVSGRAQVIIHSRTSAAGVAEDVAHLLKLGLSWAPLCDFVGLTTTPSKCPGMLLTFCRPLARSGRLKFRHLQRKDDARVLPDIFPWSVLRTSHLERVPERPSWRTVPLTSDSSEVAPQAAFVGDQLDPKQLARLLRHPELWVGSAEELARLLER